MPKNIFVDLNVIIDVLLARDNFEASKKVIELGQRADARLYISAHAVTTFAYLLEGAKVPRPEILRHINWLLKTSYVIAVDGRLLDGATKSRLADYEDAVVEQAASKAGAKVIVTNNAKDFRASSVPARTPSQ